MEPIPIQGLPSELASTVRPQRDKHEDRTDSQGKRRARREPAASSDDAPATESDVRDAPPSVPGETVGNLIDVEG